MVNMTLALPEELHRLIQKHDEVRWSEVARKALWKHAEQLEIMDQLVAKSTFTPKDVREFGDRIKKGIAKRHGL
ncbi:MAG: hypothetical protein AABX70_02610 [Nanoarchaeota archaeon]